MADVAEHGAEQQQVGDGERQRRVEFAITRDPIAFHQRHEGLEPAWIAHQRWHLGRVAGREFARVEPVAAMQARVQGFTQFIQLSAGDPARQGRQSTAAEYACLRGLGQWTRQGQTQPCFMQARTELFAQSVPDLAGCTGLRVQADAFALQPGACRLRMGTQFVRYRQFAPARLSQQAAHFVPTAARPGNHREHLFASLIETRHQIPCHGQGFGHPFEFRRRQAADARRQQTVGTQQVCQVHIQPFQLGQRVLQRPEVAARILDPRLILMAIEAVFPHAFQPVIQFLQIGERRCFGIRRWVQGAGVAAFLLQLGQARFRFEPGFAIRSRRRFRKRGLPARCRIEHAEAGQRQGGILRFGRQHQQLNSEQRFGAQHQLSSAGARRSARRISSSGKPRWRPRSTARTARRSRSRRIR